MTPDTPSMTFPASLPAGVRQGVWLPTLQVTLTLLDLHGEYTTFAVRRCPQRGVEAWNVVRTERPGEAL